MAGKYIIKHPTPNPDISILNEVSNNGSSILEITIKIPSINNALAGIFFLKNRRKIEENKNKIDKTLILIDKVINAKI